MAGVTGMLSSWTNLSGVRNTTPEWNYFDNNNWFPLQFDKFSKLHNLYLYVYPAILLFVLVSNSFIVIIFSRKHKRTSVELFLTALAISDVLACLSTTTPYFYVAVTGQSTYPIRGNLTCMLYKVGMAAGFAFHNFSAWITTAMSLQKFIAVKFPVKGRKLISKKTTMIALLVLFVFTVIYVTMEQIVFSIRVIPDTYTGTRFRINDCIIHSSDFGVKMYLAIRILLHQFLPCSVIICSTTYLSCRMLHRSSTTINNNTRAVAKRRSVLLICTVALVFFIGEIPSTVVISVRFYSKMTGDYNIPLIYKDMDVTVWVSNFLVYVSYACNFWIYIVLSKEFKSQVKFYVKCRQCSKSSLYERPRFSKINNTTE